ncbi:protein of unknown function DUF72 [Spirochaeta thermophila DSM 6578]|uniref:DUF72 domain-containing protein n=1 Tax=Winmispira thermophila (strain ATCC 700085 / DSM 6578 / Z-1203) TaxID=869211 RepID=G0GEV1_WINT7|nr:DUF72 domain-containing protein [Spirochaeta thermophila]AEJ61507.1 protein of unknown function DUF72 [Spirochaeta thermophila DSM 6578]
MEGVYVGTSGWTYRHWAGLFYPEDLPSSQLLEFYSRHFCTVEINSSFYHLPRENTCRNWAGRVPEGFLFSMKASRLITHLRKLGDVEEEVERFLSRAALLGDRLGVVLFQLPPSLHKDLDRLERFFRLLPRGFRYAIEVRHESWFDQDVYDLFSSYGVSFCIFHFHPLHAPWVVTSPTVYVRLHGALGRYRGSYSDEYLAELAEKMATWRGEGRDVFCYFDNDAEGHALHDARRLMGFLDAS